MPTARGVRPRLRKARQALMREIWRRGCAPGDRLPAQQVLREQLSFSNNTLSEAMRHLEQDQVIRRESRVGTIVVDPDRCPRGVWAIGLALPYLSHSNVSPSYLALAILLQERLRDMGCYSRVYPFLPSAHGGKERLDPTHAFAGLAEDLASDNVDGLITTYHVDAQVCMDLAGQGMPVVQRLSLHGTPRVPWQVGIDHDSMIGDAVALLTQPGTLGEQACRRISLCLVDGISASRQEHLASCFAQASRTAGLSDECARLSVSSRTGMWAGCELAQKILAQPMDQRPEGMLVLDDYLAMGMTATLAPHGSYRPRLAVVSSRQAPLPYALPVVRYDVDVSAMADQLVAMTLEAIRHPDTPKPPALVVPIAHDQQARMMSLDEMWDTQGQVSPEA